MRDNWSRFALMPPALVALAAMLWGTDGLWRTALLRTMSSPAIVLWEHILLVLVTAWLLWRDRAALAKLRRAEWLAVLIIGVGASGIATILFTQAFRHASPTTVILLQKTQPLVAISLAAVWLREALPARFWPLLPVALVGAYLISFGDAGPLASIATVVDRPLGALMALGAAALWGSGTVLGRRMLGHVPFATLAALRFATALPVLAIIAALGGWSVPGPEQVAPLVLLALVAGLLGMLLYYRGLRETPAAVATLCELSFPITAIVVNSIFLQAPLTLNQAIGIVLLWSALALMRHRPAPARTATPVPATAGS